MTRYCIFARVSFAARRPAHDVKVTCRVPDRKVARLTAYSADSVASVGPIAFESHGAGLSSHMTFTLPNVFLSTIAVIEYSREPNFRDTR
jgi:hypothetical protein